MIRLSDTQAIVLSAAAQRPEGNLLPLPGSLHGGAATKVVAALLSRGLAREQPAERLVAADAALNAFWRNEADGRGALLLITAAGRAALGLEPDSAPERLAEAEVVRSASEPAVLAYEPPAARTKSPSRKTRDGTKQAQLITMLERPEGATVAEIVAATGWQQHTIRGAFAGALKKRLGLTVVSEKVEGRGRVYRVAR